jgi:hypothetical protein
VVEQVADVEETHLEALTAKVLQVILVVKVVTQVRADLQDQVVAEVVPLQY